MKSFIIESNGMKYRQQLQLSVFDRLDQDVAEGLISGAAADIDVVRNAVLRDVENLLNTRRLVDTPQNGTPRLRESMYVYGIGDFIAQNPRNGRVQKILESSIREVLSRFEPRLRDVRVEFRPGDHCEPNLCFVVSATLHAEPVEEPIFFNTWFSASRGEYRIDPERKGAGGNG